MEIKNLTEKSLEKILVFLEDHPIFSKRIAQIRRVIGYKKSIRIKLKNGKKIVLIKQGDSFLTY